MGALHRCLKILEKLVNLEHSTTDSFYQGSTVGTRVLQDLCAQNHCLLRYLAGWGLLGKGNCSLMATVCGWPAVPCLF